MTRPRLRSIGWNVERPCVFHVLTQAATKPNDAHVYLLCPACGVDGPLEIAMLGYDLEIHGAYYPGSPAYTPPGEYAPIDPPEPPEFHIGRVCFAGTDVEFPWSLTEAEQQDIESYVCEMESL